MYSIDEMVEICVKGDVVKPENAEYLRRNLEEFVSYDMPAIVKKVQRMEAAINQAITDCIPLLSWIDDDDTAVEMVEHLSEILGGALCKQPE